MKNGNEIEEINIVEILKEIDDMLSLVEVKEYVPSNKVSNREMALIRLENLFYEYHYYELNNQITSSLHKDYYFQCSDIQELYKFTTKEHNFAFDNGKERAIQKMAEKNKKN